MPLILGLDPSLSCTGWGVIRVDGSRLTHIANGQIATNAKASMPERLATLHQKLLEVIAAYQPTRAACEEVFLNKNPQSTLKLAQARGAVLAACGSAGLPVREHAARLVKKAVVGTGAAEKAQVQAMLKVLLPGAHIAGADAADALAVAIADAHLARIVGTPQDLVGYSVSGIGDLTGWAVLDSDELLDQLLVQRGRGVHVREVYPWVILPLRSRNIISNAHVRTYKKYKVD